MCYVFLFFIIMICDKHNFNLECNICNKFRPSFDVFSYENGEEFTHINEDSSVLFFILSGKVMVNGVNCSNLYVEAENMFLLPKKSTYYVSSCNHTDIVTCELSRNVNLCNKYSFQNLYKEINHDEIDRSFKVMEIKERLVGMLEHLRLLFGDGLRCTRYQEAKRDELLILLRGYYTKTELAELFYPILFDNIDFGDFVLQNYMNVKDYKELADMMGMSQITFSRRFMESFRESPGKWLEKKKAEAIYIDIRMTHLPLADIADKYNFSSNAYFSTFCKRHFGKSPRELREC